MTLRSKFFVALWSVLCVLAAIPAASAEPSPPFGSSSGPITATPSSPLSHHGIVIGVHLNATVVDGTDAAFSLSVKNTGNSAVRYSTVAVGWSFDGNAPKLFARLKLPGGTTYVDLNRHWVRSGTIAQGSAYQLAGNVHVADRSKIGSRAAKNAKFFCIAVALSASYPGKSNATWYEVSKPTCQQYSVK